MFMRINSMQLNSGYISLRIISLLLLLLYPQNMHDLLLCWSTEDTKMENEPRREKTGLRGFRPGPTQTGLYKLRKELEA